MVLGAGQMDEATVLQMQKAVQEELKALKVIGTKLQVRLAFARVHTITRRRTRTRRASPLG